MVTYKLLSLDESGKASYSHPSDLFVLSGTIIPEKFKPRLDALMRKIKKKYFSDEDIVFHSRDMHRRKVLFRILQDRNTENSFWSDFISITNNQILTWLLLCQQNNAQKANFGNKNILKRAY